jgi:IMP dehydrogenase
MYKEYLSFDDVLLVPQFSTIKSRKDVDTSTKLMGLNLKLPIISSNMDTVTESTMANAMAAQGAVGALHRFCTIEQNVDMFLKCTQDVMVSVGLGTTELERFEALMHAGAREFILDVAHGSSMEVVKQVKQMRDIEVAFDLMVGNFATGRSIQDFLYHLGNYGVDAWKVGIGGGSGCTTRIVTGCGLPTFGSIVDCVQATTLPVIADGGCRTSGDVAKALAAGASAVMLGGMLAATDESPGILVDRHKIPVKYDNFNTDPSTPKFKKYRGSASAESYEIQGKTASHRAPEGDSFLVPYKGSVAKVLSEIDGGLRSAMSYVGASNLTEFREYAEFIKVTPSGAKESGSHGKSR